MLSLSPFCMLAIYALGLLVNVVQAQTNLECCYCLPYDGTCFWEIRPIGGTIVTTTVTTRIPVTTVITESTTVTVPITVTDTIIITSVSTIKVPVTTTSTTTITAVETPVWACPSDNRIVNPGFENSCPSWYSPDGARAELTNPDGGADRHVMLTEFTGPGQTRSFNQIVHNLCPGRAYAFKAEIQMWKGTGSAYVDYYMDNVLFLKTESLITGAWVTVTGTVVARSSRSALRVVVTSNGGGAARSFVQDDFSLTLT
ncbi:hypothetical protein BDZ91DRAFT_783692 [Kalaharituber pfeilii]|nr:hypothetical protein BDZ91DRAFT_783692 [Kalaharituber pfeilii]